MKTKCLLILLWCFITLLDTPHAWAQIRSFPSPPILLNPPDGATLQFPGPGAKILFEWEPVANATEYEMNVTLDRRPLPPVRTRETFIIRDLGLESTHVNAKVAWSVRSISDSIQSFQVETASFQFGVSGTFIPGIAPTATPTPLPPANLVAPLDGVNLSVIDQQAVTFEWEAVEKASRYQLFIYQDNQPIVQRVLINTFSIESFSVQRHSDVLQWEVRTFDSTNQLGPAGLRSSFSIGLGVLPTPTPVPPDADLNRDGKLSAHDVYLFAARYWTNDPFVDYNNTGLNDRSDLAQFVGLYLLNKN